MTATRLQTRTRIVEAASRLLHEQGPAAVTTRNVATAAGVQAPAIYRLFGDKDGLLDAVAEQEFARYVSEKTTAEETDDPIADLHAAWDRHVQFGLANPALFTLLTNPERAARSPVAAAGLDVLRTRVRRVAAAGRLRVPEQQAVDLIHAAGTGAVLALLATTNRDPTLPDTLYDAVMRTVLTDVPTPGEDPVRTAAIALRAAALPMLTPSEHGLLMEWVDRMTR